jgi:sulfur carrier protein
MVIQTAAPVEGARPFVFITISVNGKPMEIAAGTTVDGLLTLLNVKREYTAVAVNRDITPKSTYTAVTLSEGDKVEIVRPMGGG